MTDQLKQRECTKPLPDPCDEREPVNRCKCPRCSAQQPADCAAKEIASGVG